MNKYPSSNFFYRLRVPVSWILALTISATAVGAIAVQDSQAQAQQATADCNGLRDAARNAMNNHLLIVDSFMKGATESMQHAVSTSNSCIGDVAMADIDLSGMVPDFGLLAGILAGAVEKLAKGVFNRVCNEIKHVVQTATGSWNGAVGEINKKMDVDGQTQTWARGVDYKVEGEVNKNIGSTYAPVPTVIAGAVAPRVCVNTLNGQICSDGATSATGTGTGTTATGTSGAYIGAEYARRSEACSQAVGRYRSFQGEYGSTTQTTNNLNEVKSVCGDLQNYINSNAAYIAPGSIPTYPEYPITTPSNLGASLYAQPTAASNSTTQSGLSLPVRQ